MAQKDRHTGNLSPEFALLGFLIDGPSHGYDLHQRFIVELGHVWHLSQSQAYAILKRLEQRGDINAQIVEQNKLPARQMLRITAQGRSEEHTSELQSLTNLVCRLLLEKKKKYNV